MKIDIFSLFPEYFAALAFSVIGKSQDIQKLSIVAHNLRDFSESKHRTVDDTPYGGGPGMVMDVPTWMNALDDVLQKTVEQSAQRSNDFQRPTLVIPAPSGTVFTQDKARQLAQKKHIIFACGRYEGIDQRVFDIVEAERNFDVDVLSLGDYILNGGEVAAMAMIEAIVRLVPGVIGNEKSLEEESHENNLLEYPAYTRPARYNRKDTSYDVPQVLLSGNHQAISEWRFAQSLERTVERRPDMFDQIDTKNLDMQHKKVYESVAGKSVDSAS